MKKLFQKISGLKNKKSGINLRDKIEEEVEEEEEEYLEELEGFDEKLNDIEENILSSDDLDDDSLFD